VNAGFARLGGSGRIEIGPVFRHLVEVGNWDDYRVVSSTGQSGDPTSWRYRQHVPAWREGRLFRMPFTRDAIERASKQQGVLEPV
jgi:penicillin amidase